jgi:phosphohistidine swiveling domain-containing protein
MKKFLTVLMLAILVAAPLAAQKADKPAPAGTPDNALTIVQSGKTLQLQNATVGDKIEVLSIVGVRVLEKRIESASQSVTLDVPKGYYIVRVGNSIRKISVK